LIPWTAKPNKTLTFEYSGAVNSQNEDKINAKQVYLTAWWLPTIGRLPYTTSVRVVGPKSWVLKSEGPEVDPQSFGPMNPLGSDEQVKAFKCDVPISYPKVIGGAYSLAAEAVANGRTFRSYQLEPVDKELGRREVKSIAMPSHSSTRPWERFRSTITTASTPSATTVSRATATLCSPRGSP
jgi:hypothetical protein